jgi:Zn-dependent protease
VRRAEPSNLHLRRFGLEPQVTFMAVFELASQPRACSRCGAQVAPNLLVCPACGALVHAETLKGLAERAERAQAGGDARTALAAWREAMELLPPDSVQSKRIGEKAAALSREVEALPIIPAPPTETSTNPSGRGAWWAALGGVGLLLWKFKFILVFVFSKLKLLVFGLSKGTTVLSMLASAGVYWAAFGWQFGVGLVLSIYVHEIGHVAALQRLGIKATAPMFIPGLGAFIRSKQYPASVREDAYIGLAGPIWGMGAAIACFLMWLGTGYGLWAALTQWGAIINLFNLTPFGTLDGGRGFRALSRGARWVIVGLSAAAAVATAVPIAWLLVIVGVVRAFAEKDAPAEADTRAFLQFILLIVVLSLLYVAPGWLGHTIDFR